MVDTKLVDTKSSFTSAFSKLLDSRILKALADLGFARPTLVQSKAIPLALEGRDILARARTGSGKTAAYCIPIVQKILRSKDAQSSSTSHSSAIILVPTKELAAQVTSYLRGLLVYCDKVVSFANVTSGTPNQLQRMLLADIPDILIATPARALALLQSKSISLSSLESLAIDEADLILSYGHDADVRQILSGEYLPKVYQSYLMSATMTKDVETLKGLVLRNPAILKLTEDEDEAANLNQFLVRCTEQDKFLLAYVILKLKLVKGKCILFVNDVDRCYRLKLFLEQFSIKSCVLNPELPINSRFHIVQEFNKGVYDYIIASDESAARGEVDEEGDSEGGDSDEDEDVSEGEGSADPSIPQASPNSDAEPSPENDADNVDDVQPTPGPSTSSTSTSKSLKRKLASPPPSSSKRARQEPAAPSKKQKKPVHLDKEYGVSRGVDFVDVACVINFDLPTSARGYTHRIGRTARAGKSGMAISFVVPKDQWGKDKSVTLDSAKNDEKVFARIEKEQGGRGSKVNEYKFDMKQVEAFRYRMEDALRAVTKNAIKEARIKELKTELLNSDKLKAHFEDNPLDLEYLRHDKPLHPTRVQSHMKHVPKYLVPRIAPAVLEGASLTPESLADAASEKREGDLGFVPFHKNGANRGRGGKRGGRGGGRGGGRKKDPLKKFGR